MNQLLNGGIGWQKLDYERAIFHKDNLEQPISQWWDSIEPAGLLKDETNYYLVFHGQNKQYAIFHKDNPEEPITNWHQYISPFGLVNGSSECYAVVKGEKKLIQVYHLHDISFPKTHSILTNITK